MENVFAKRLKQAREERGMTQMDLAGRVGICQSEIGRYETGQIQPVLRSLVGLAQELDCSLDFLCGLEDS